MRLSFVTQSKLIKACCAIVKSHDDIVYLATGRAEAAQRKVDFLHFVLSRQFKFWNYIVKTSNRFTLNTAEVNVIVMMSMTFIASLTACISNHSIYINYLVDISVFHQSIEHPVDGNTIAKPI
jgi:hypothetical protein